MSWLGQEGPEKISGKSDGVDGPTLSPTGLPGSSVSTWEKSSFAAAREPSRICSAPSDR
jgi:hypothetical protein